MAYTFDSVDVWAGTIEDRPGGLADKLAALADAGANLEFIIARRDTPGRGVVFFAPVEGPRETHAAEAAGLDRAESIRSLRITGPDDPGLTAKMTRALGDAGINMRGLSGAKSGEHCVFYIAFDNPADLGKARRVLEDALG